MTDYTQYGEGPYILSACGIKDGDTKEKRAGRFLDIGGYDPCDKSNTRALYECGWTGLIIEPEPNAMIRLLTEYGKEPRITLLSAAVGTEPCWGARMWITADGTSTDSADFYERWKDQVKYDGQMLVPHITLEQIKLQFGGFDMVSIDVEGKSADLAIQLFDQGWQCRCVVLEHDDRMVEIGKAATRRGYHMTLINGTNAVFAK